MKDSLINSSKTATFIMVNGKLIGSQSTGVMAQLDLVCNLADQTQDENALKAAKMVRETIRPLVAQHLPQERLPILVQPNDAALVLAQELELMKSHFRQLHADHEIYRQAIVSMGDEMAKNKLPTPAIYLQAKIDGDPVTTDEGWDEEMRLVDDKRAKPAR